jgi:hypothetical protein
MVPNCLLTCGTTEECDEAGPPKGQKLCMAMTVRTCLVWTLEVLILLMFCLGLAVLVEFVVVHPQPPKCDISSLTLSNFSTSSMNANASAAHDGRGSFTPVQMLTAVIAVTVKAHNQITHIGTFYDHVHVMGGLTMFIIILEVYISSQFWIKHLVQFWANCLILCGLSSKSDIFYDVPNKSSYCW